MNRKGLAVAAAALVVAGAGVGIGLAVTSGPPVATVSPPTSCAAPPTFVSNHAYNETGKCFTLGAKSVDLGPLSNVTIDGGTWTDPNKSPTEGSKQHANTPKERGRPAFLFGTGAGDTLENLTITGADFPGGYNANLAFESGIWANGTHGLTLKHVTVDHVFGDCLTLAPIRGLHGDIQASVTGLTVNGLTTTACGRQGISPVSVNGATFTNVSIGSSGYDSVDDEADQQAGEGAKNLTFNSPCTFAKLISIKSGGKASGPITFNGCSIDAGPSPSGEALIVFNLDKTTPGGPITFNGSTLRCGTSADVACLQLSGADVVLTNSTIKIGFAQDQFVPTLFHATKATSLTFAGTKVSGKFKAGTSDSTSTVVGAP